MPRADRKKARARGLTLFVVGVAVLVLVYAGWQRSGPREDGDSKPDAAMEETRPAEPTPSGSPRAADAEAESTKPPDDAPSPAEPLLEGQAQDLQRHEILAEMRDVWECYKVADCTLGEDTDPRAEYFEAGERLAAGMRMIIEQHRAHRIGDFELAEAAHEALQYDSGPVRAAAIEALGELPPADEHLGALVTALDQHHDEKLFEIALPELQRYAESGRREAVDAFLQSNLRSGAHFAARTIARELGPFLTPENVTSYRDLVEELPEDSRRAALLMETLSEFEETE